MTTLEKKIEELTEEELKEVVGGAIDNWQVIEPHSRDNELDTQNPGNYYIFYGD